MNVTPKFSRYDGLTSFFILLGLISELLPYQNMNVAPLYNGYSVFRTNYYPEPNLQTPSYQTFSEDILNLEQLLSMLINKGLSSSFPIQNSSRLSSAYNTSWFNDWKNTFQHVNPLRQNSLDELMLKGRHIEPDEKNNFLNSKLPPSSLLLKNNTPVQEGAFFSILLLTDNRTKFQ